MRILCLILPKVSPSHQKYKQKFFTIVYRALPVVFLWSSFISPISFPTSLSFIYSAPDTWVSLLLFEQSNYTVPHGHCACSSLPASLLQLFQVFIQFYLFSGTSSDNSISNYKLPPSFTLLILFICFIFLIVNVQIIPNQY